MSTPTDQGPFELDQARSVIPVEVTGKTGAPEGHPKMLKPSHPEFGN